MLPNHHLPQLTPNRIQAAVNRLQAACWTNRRPVLVEASESQAEQMSLAQGKQLARVAVEPCSFWGKLFDQRWCRVALPEAADENTWMEWKDQGEATLYVDDKAYFGFNVAHSYCRLPKGTQEVWLQSSCIQSAIWHDDANGMDAEGSYFESASVMVRDDEAWGAYHDLQCLLELALDQRHRENPQVPITLNGNGFQALVDKFSPVYRLMLKGMDRAADALDQYGVSALRESLAGLYAELKMDKNFSKCVLTGHAHVDLVWIWPERMGELKAVNVFATADRLMEDYPEYRFAYSQPASYEAVARREPELYDRVLGRIESKQWEATGAMYVESDTMIACGEALARSFVLGQEGFEEINGALSKLTWLPDVFGYSACLPQIMKQMGVEYFFTTKMVWNAINRFPYSSFIWRGNDGSEVLAHVTQESGYVTHMTVDNVKTPMHANQQADVHDEFLLPTGYGDGGGGPTDAMLERARRLGSLPGMPEIEWDQPENFFDRLNTVRNDLPVHQGECYLEYHRGTFTTHGNLKEIFRKLERVMQLAEAVSVATGKTWEMENAWKRLVFAQFHDYIPGSSVWDVYLEGLPELEREAVAQLAATAEALVGEGADCLFNPHAVTVNKWVESQDGSEPVYVSLPPLSGSELDAVATATSDAVSIEGLTVSNGLTEFSVNDSGWIDALSWEGVTVPLREPLGQLVVHPDVAANFDAWDIDRHVLSLGDVCAESATIEPFTDGPHRAGVRVSRPIGDHSHATISFYLLAGDPLLHVSAELDWQDAESLLKLYLPTEYGATNARFGTPYGSVLRPQLPGSMVSEAMWEVPFSRYMAVFDEGEREGLFVISEAKYGVNVRSGEIGISLIRSPKVTGFDAHGTAWPAHLSRYGDQTPYSDIGRHEISLALGRYDIAHPRERQPACLADTVFTAPLAYTGAPVASLLEQIEGGETLIPTWAKPAKGAGWVLRLAEASGQRGQVKLCFPNAVTLSRTNLGETVSTPIAAGEAIAFGPYEVVSILVSS